TPDKWAICGDPHPTNFSRCSKNLINTKPAKPTVNVWEERKKQQQAKMALQTQHTDQLIKHNTTSNPARD
ncbi:hypothetical protein NPIL_261531, partial [Nephila pilipes]